MKTLTFEQMEQVNGGGNANVDFACGAALAIGVLLCFSPFFAAGVTVAAHSAACIALNNTNM
ncbi:MAG: hypothetical protein LBS55_03900 [Prevotellaceae bacterium]|jgi:cytochrome c biogenesis protein CcdA|nr:hypothetical protein [Prevotellaceae bacterium]